MKILEIAIGVCLGLFLRSAIVMGLEAWTIRRSMKQRHSYHSAIEGRWLRWLRDPR